MFAQWQPRYAEAGIPTFPVGANKKPAISGYLKTGPNASRQLAEKFGDMEALGFACRRAGVTVGDVDAPCENLLADTLDRYGDTPIIVQSGGGNFQAWYAHGGEGRQIRPLGPDVPFDILGNGYVVAPPSRGAKGDYRFIRGSLDDLPSLPRMRASEVLTVNPVASPALERVNVGKRNLSLWEACMRHANAGCLSFDDLLCFGHDANAEMMAEPLPEGEVVAVVRSAWDTTAAGNNLFGRERLVGLTTAQLDRIDDPHALMLMMKLRRHWRDGETFAVANVMSETMGWPRKRFAAARSTLEAGGLLVMVRRPSKGTPTRPSSPGFYRFG